MGRETAGETVSSFQAGDEMPLHGHFYVAFNKAKIRQMYTEKV